MRAFSGQDKYKRTKVKGIVNPRPKKAQGEETKKNKPFN